MRFCGKFLAFLAVIFLALSNSPSYVANADTISVPSFNLDGANTTSLATSNPTFWKDLISGTTQLTLGANTSRSSEGGGSLQVSSGNGAQGNQSGSSGAYLAPTTINAASNPSGDMTLMIWIKPTSWNSDWNIFATRWFSDLNGTGGPSDYHFAIRSSGATRKLNLYTTSASNMYGDFDFTNNTNKWFLVGFTLTSSGNMQMYINGQKDGVLRLNASHTASSSSYLFVGDLRNGNYCWTCSLNGYIGKFRIWNQVLTPSQISDDYKNEAANFGYATSLTLSLASNSPIYRTNNTITATISGPSDYAGKISFYENGKVISGCKNKTTSVSNPTCTWKPRKHGVTTISASYIPSDLNYLNGNSSSTYNVRIRTNTR